MDLGYWLYMNEAEGYPNMVNTRLAKLNAIGRQLAEDWPGQVIPTPLFLAYCKENGISDITQEEALYIEKEWL